MSYNLSTELLKELDFKGYSKTETLGTCWRRDVPKQKEDSTELVFFAYIRSDMVVEVKLYSYNSFLGSGNGKTVAEAEKEALSIAERNLYNKLTAVRKQIHERDKI